MISKLIAFLRWARCDKCGEPTDQTAMSGYWVCTICKSKVDKKGRIVK